MANITGQDGPLGLLEDITDYKRINHLYHLGPGIIRSTGATVGGLVGKAGGWRNDRSSDVPGHPRTVTS